MPPPRPPVPARSEPEMLELKKVGANPRPTASRPTLVLRDPTRMVELPASSTRASAAPLEVQVLSSDGRVLATEHHKSPPTNAAWLSRLNPQEIESIEVVKRAIPCLARNANAAAGCNRVTITLKPGYTFRPR